MSRKNRVKTRLLCSILILALIFTGIPASRYAEAAKKPKLSKKTAKLYVGKTVKLKVNNYKKKVKWSSSNKKIATVTGKGVVKAKKKGTAKITAKAGKKKLTCKVTVMEKKKTNPVAEPQTPPDTGDDESGGNQDSSGGSGNQSGESGNPSGGTPTSPGGNQNPPGGTTPPPGGNQNPGGGTTNPPGGNQNPGGEMTTPPGGNENPGGTTTNPPGGNQNPGEETTTPPGENDNPGGGSENPSGGTPTGTPVPPILEEDTGVSQDEQEKKQEEGLNGVNSKRAEENLPALEMDERLNYAASLMGAKYMENYNNEPSKEDQDQILADVNFTYESYKAIFFSHWEDAAYDTALNNGWQYNSDIMAVILSDSYDTTGFAYLRYDWGGSIWVQIFAKKATVPEPVPGPGPAETPGPGSTESPSTSTTPPSTATTAPPKVTTAPPKTTTAPPKATTAPPKTTTAPPKTTTAPPKTTTAPPKTTTAPPKTTTAPPKTTTAPPTTTTAPPKTTTAPTPKPLDNPGTITLNDGIGSHSWNTVQPSTASKVTITKRVTVTISCSSEITDAEIWYTNIRSYTETGTPTDFSNSFWKASGGTQVFSTKVTIDLNSQHPENYIYVRILDKKTGYAYYLSTPQIYLDETTATSPPATSPPTTTVTPTTAPTATPASGTAGTNNGVDYTGKTVFEIGNSTHTYKLALGLKRNDVNTVLGTLSTDAIRPNANVPTVKSPQRFDVIAFRQDGNNSQYSFATGTLEKKYETYILVYLKDDTVIGITAIAPNMSYGSINANTLSFSSVPSGWSSVSFYNKTAYTTDVGGNHVIAYNDYLGDKKTYCLQVFSSLYDVDEMTDPSKATHFTLDYSEAVTDEMATEAGELLNAYLVHTGLRAMTINSKLSDVAKAYSKTIQVENAEWAGRSEGLIESAIKTGLGYGNNDKLGSFGERILIGSVDGIGFANMAVERSDTREYLRNDTNYSVMGLGASFYLSDKYYPNMVIDFVTKLK